MTEWRMPNVLWGRLFSVANVINQARTAHFNELIEKGVYALIQAGSMYEEHFEIFEWLTHKACAPVDVLYLTGCLSTYTDKRSFSILLTSRYSRFCTPRIRGFNNIYIVSLAVRLGVLNFHDSATNQSTNQNIQTAWNNNTCSWWKNNCNTQNKDAIITTTINVEGYWEKDFTHPSWRRIVIRNTVCKAFTGPGRVLHPPYI